MPGWALIGTNGLAVGLLMGLLWLVSLVKRDVSVVDPFWSIGFAIVAWNTTLQSAWTPDKVLLLGLVTLWAVRLWVYLLYRGWGEEEDFRYQSFRERYGPERYWWISLVQVFGLQGLLILIISAPLQVALSAAPPDPISAVDVAGTILFGIGFLFEAVGDWQLLSFKADPENEGRVLDRGLWRYTRHPNYFGEAVLWWGFWVSTLDAPVGGWTIFAPILMTVLLLRVSGVAMLEPAMKKRKPAYEEYIARTSPFFPWPPSDPKED